MDYLSQLLILLVMDKLARASVVGLVLAKTRGIKFSAFAVFVWKRMVYLEAVNLCVENL